MRLAWMMAVVFAAALAFGQEGPARLSDDDRLSKKITMIEAAAPLEAVVQRLAKETGVTITLMPSLKDFKAGLSVKSKKAYSLMDALALTFDLKWEREGEAPGFKYRLVQTGLQKSAQDALLGIFDEQRRQSSEETLRRNAAMADKPFPTVKGEVAALLARIGQLEEEKPAGWREAASELYNDPRLAHGEDLLTNYLAGIVVRQMKPDDWKQLWAGELISAAPSGSKFSLPAEVSDWIKLQRESEQENSESSMASVSYGNPRVTLQYHADRGLFLVLSTDSLKSGHNFTAFETSQLIVSDQLLKDRGLHNYSWVLHGETAEWLLEEKDLAVKLVSAPKGPERGVFTLVRPHIGEMLVMVGKSTDVALVVEVTRQTAQQPQNVDTVGSWLAGLEFEFDIKRQGEFVAVRDRAFYLHRATETPESRWAPLEAAYKKNGRLSLDDWSRFLTGLTPKQVVALQTVSVASSVPWNLMPENVPAVQFWGILTPEQRKKAETGLPYSSLTPELKAAFMRGFYGNSNFAQDEAPPEKEWLATAEFVAEMPVFRPEPGKPSGNVKPKEASQGPAGLVFRLNDELTEWVTLFSEADEEPFDEPMEP